MTSSELAEANILIGEYLILSALSALFRFEQLSNTLIRYERVGSGWEYISFK